MEQLPDLHQWAMTQPHLRGFNVTIPHKQTIIAQLDALSPAATGIGAVNVVRIVRSADGEVRLLGDNSDWVGFTESLRPLLRPDIQRALVLGTGGASRAVIVALRKLGIHPTYVSRYPLPQGVEVGGAVVPVLTLRCSHARNDENASSRGQYHSARHAPQSRRSASHPLCLAHVSACAVRLSLQSPRNVLHAVGQSARGCREKWTRNVAPSGRSRLGGMAHACALEFFCKCHLPPNNPARLW